MEIFEKGHDAVYPEKFELIKGKSVLIEDENRGRYAFKKVATKMKIYDFLSKESFNVFFIFTLDLNGFSLEWSDTAEREHGRRVSLHFHRNEELLRKEIKRIFGIDDLEIRRRSYNPNYERWDYKFNNPDVDSNIMTDLILGWSS